MLRAQPPVSRARCPLHRPRAGLPTHGHSWDEQPCSGALWNTRQELTRSCHGVVAGHACPCGVQPHGRFVASGEGQPGVRGRPQALAFPQLSGFTAGRVWERGSERGARLL
ncbi:unnamed protein product [Coccothraustes coccothraustes]